MTVIEARGLRKAFGPTIALDGIDVHIEEGRILGLIGPNGAGKAASLTSLLLPGDASVVSRFALIPEVAGELSIMLWLLIKGVRVQLSEA